MLPQVEVARHRLVRTPEREVKPSPTIRAFLRTLSTLDTLSRVNVIRCT